MDEINEMMAESGVAETTDDGVQKSESGGEGADGSQGADNRDLNNDNGGGEGGEGSGDASDTDPDKPQSFTYSEHFADYENIDQVKETATRGKLYTKEVEDELTTLRQGKDEFETLKAENEKLRNVNPYEDPKFYKLDKLAKENPDEIGIYQKYLFGDPTPLDLLKMNLTQENPDIFKEDPASLLRMLERKYPGYYEKQSEDWDDNEIADWQQRRKDAELDMKIDAKKVSEGFDEKINAIEVPNVETKTPEQIKEENSTYIKSWDENFKQLRTDFTKIAIPVLDTKDSTKAETFMEYEIPEKELKEVHELAANYIIENRLESTPENAKTAKDVAMGLYIINNFAKLNTMMLDKTMEDSGEKWRKRIHNPKADGADDKGTKTVSDKKEEGSSEDIFDKVTDLDSQSQ